MVERVLTLLVGLLGGVSVGLQGPIAGSMGRKVGGAAGSFIVHVSGAIFSGLLLVARRGENIREWRTLSWYMLVSGIFGLILYLTLVHTLPRVGAATAVSLIIVGQLLIGMIFDHFGWFGVPVRPMDVSRLIAAALLLAGGYLMAR